MKVKLSEQPICCVNLLERRYECEQYQVLSQSYFELKSIKEKDAAPSSLGYRYGLWCTFKPH